MAEKEQPMVQPTCWDGCGGRPPVLRGGSLSPTVSDRQKDGCHASVESQAGWLETDEVKIFPA